MDSITEASELHASIKVNKSLSITAVTIKVNKQQIDVKYYLNRC